MAYDYKQAVLDDIEAVLPEYDYIFKDCVYDGEIDYKRLECDLFEQLWIDDSVTGNGNGTYTFSSVEAEQNLVGNWDLMLEARDELGGVSSDPEMLDVTIRCYLLSGCLHSVLEDLEYDVPEWLQEILDESKGDDDEEEEDE